MICRRSIVCHVSLNRVYVYILYRMRWDTFETFNVFCFFSRCLCVALIWLSFLFVCFIIVFFLFYFVSFVISRGPPLFAGTDRKREEYVFYFLFSAGGKKTKQENRKRDTITRCCCPPHLIFPTFLLFVQFLFFFLSLHCSPNMAQNIIIIILTFCFCFFFSCHPSRINLFIPSSRSLLFPDFSALVRKSLLFYFVHVSCRD